MPEEVTIAGEGWRLEDLAALVAERRSTTGPLRRTVDGRRLWALATVLDGPYDRREANEPALAEGGAVAAA